MAEIAIAQKMDHFRVEDLKEESYTQHGMTGFDTAEENLPPGYFRNSFFVGTMHVISATT